jgi:hypothetical protein
MNNYLTRLVKHILLENDVARDDWMLTIRLVHDKEMQLWYFKKEDYYDAFFSKKLSNVDTIKRLWALLQERIPELRGVEWELRQRQGGMIASEIIDDNQLKLWE